MNKSNIFIVLGIVFILVAIISYSTKGLPYHVTSNSVSISSLYINHLFFSLLFGIIGSILTILGIDKK